MAEQKPKGKFRNMLFYPYFGGLKLNRLLKKNKHKQEQEKQIKQDYTQLCFKEFIGYLIVIIIFSAIALFLNTKTKSDWIHIFANLGLASITAGGAITLADKRREIRGDLIYELCKECGEYKNWEKKEELVDKETEIKQDIEYRDSEIYGNSGRVIGTISSPISVFRKVTYLTYYVSRKCNCCGQVYYYYDTRTE